MEWRQIHMKQIQLNKLFSIVLTIMYLPLVCLWMFVIVNTVVGITIENWSLYFLMNSGFMISTAILSWLCRALLLCRRPFLGAIMVCAFFSIIAIVFFAIDEAPIGIGAFVAIFFIIVAILLDKPIRAFLKYLNKNQATMISSLCRSGMIVLAWAISCLFVPFLSQGTVDNIAIGYLALLGYACFCGRLYDVFVSCSLKPRLTRLISMIVMIGCSLAGIVIYGGITDSDSETAYFKSTIMLWIAIGFLLYDLGCFVVRQFGKKLA